MGTRIAFHESLAVKKRRVKKGDKVLTASGDIETVIRKNKNGNVETEESQYTWGLHNLKFIS
jgi:preprotein translocase subunit YajC